MNHDPLSHLMRTSAERNRSGQALPWRDRIFISIYIVSAAFLGCVTLWKLVAG